MAALGCSNGDILSASPTIGDSSWSQHQTSPEMQLGLRCSLQGASQSCQVPLENPSSFGGSSKCPVSITVPSCWMLWGAYTTTGGGLSHVSSNPRTGSGPCRR